MRFLFMLFGTFAITHVIIANPVIYQDGKMIDMTIDSKAMDVEYFYSLTSQMSVGYRYFQIASEASPMHIVQTNVLLKRWNEPDTQANVYIMTGLGFQKQKLISYLGAETDWESREYYISGAAEYYWAQKPSTKVIFRIGMAPYKAEYDELNTWFILQAIQLNSGNDQSRYSLPTLRLFKDNALIELGSNGKIHSINLRLHF